MPTESSKVVFLSYASQDAEAARRICESLRSGGVEVWFDAEGGLEHGDAWDAKIRRLIGKECVLFIPLISANTQARHEGYFRIEWELAAQRAMGIASGVAFILPVVIDDTREPDALVPDRFRMVQWTRLPGGVVSPEVLQRFLKLWSHRTGARKQQELEPGRPRPGERGEPPSPGGFDVPRGTVSPAQSEVGRPLRARLAWLAAAAVTAAIFAILGWRFLHRSVVPEQPPETARGSAPPTGEKSVPTLSEAAKLAEDARRHYSGIFTREDLVLAEEFGRRASELDPRLARAWAVRAGANAAHLMRGFVTGEAAQQRARDAQRFSNRALAIERNEPEALLALGQLAMFQNAPGQAEAFYRRVLTLDPENRFARRFLSIVLRSTGRVPEAIELMQDAARRAPDDVLTHFDLALAYAYGWDWPKAWAAADAALALQPFAGAQMLKVRLAFQWKGDLALMRALLAEVDVTYRGEDDAVLWDMRCGLFERRPDRVLEAAGRTARTYLEETFIFPGPKAWFPAQAHQLAGRDGLARQQWQAAETVLRERLHGDPQNLELRLKLAVTLAWLKRTEEARSELAAIERAWREQLNPERAWDLASYYAASGDATAAVPLLRIALHAGTGVAPLTINHLRLDPWWDQIREAPEFRALLANPPPMPTPPTSPPAVQTEGSNQKSVAVLPFANQSDDKENEYFSDGIADELLTVLQKIPGLRVAARTSAWSFKGKNPTVREVGEKLGMAHVVEGSVQKIGNRVKITARLSRAATNDEVWSKSFGPLELTDVFATQSEIAQAIVGELRGRLTGEAAATAKAEIQAQVQAAEKGGTKNPEAHAHYLQARFFGRSQDNAGWRKSVEECRSALALDQNYVLAAAEMARAYIHLARFGGIPLAEGFQAARPAAERAIALSPDLPEANNALGWVQRTADWDWRRADASFRRAYELAPQSADMIRDYAVIRNNLGFLEEAIELGRRAVDLDPLNASSHSYQSLFLAWAGHTDEAVAEMKRGMELAPSAVEWHSYLARFQTLQGQLDEAAVTAEGEPSESCRLFSRALVLLARKDRPAAERTINELIEKYGETMNNYVAELYAFAGDADRAFEWLERARARRETAMVWVKFTPTFRPLHSDPRWAALLKKMGLADEQLK